MDPRDLALRNLTYGLFARLARAPSAAEVAAAGGTATGYVLETWRRLHDAHALVLDASGTRIRMANPFSGVPTGFRVRVRDRSWYANCAWDAFGVCAALDADGRIETACPDCRRPLTIAVRDGRPDAADLLFHCLVPAAAWWDDIVFT